MGDHYQLPPLVASMAAEAGGLGRSLFRILCEAHPQVCPPIRLPTLRFMLPFSYFNYICDLYMK